MQTKVVTLIQIFHCLANCDFSWQHKTYIFFEKNNNIFQTTQFNQTTIFFNHSMIETRRLLLLLFIFSCSVDKMALLISAPVLMKFVYFLSYSIYHKIFCSVHTYSSENYIILIGWCRLIHHFDCSMELLTVYKNRSRISENDLKKCLTVTFLSTFMYHLL